MVVAAKRFVKKFPPVDYLHCLGNLRSKSAES